ncbi:SapC family protein [Sulfurimonas hydrogeniphila]|uniref:SapC family protein n=1 Tax=Sulfurimonas TaxID=202746 RepID=UPI00125FC376|nr:SapC family protein [Sulfurimonas hydrogeniphila]
MARKTRVFVENLSQHVLLKSINDMVLFKDSDDYTVFMNIVKELSADNLLHIHAYSLLSQCFEFLATPAAPDTLPKFMQSLGRRYVGYYNKKYQRSGTLWEGRYKASLVEDKSFLFDVMIYIEQLAGKNHSFSSIGKNLYSRADSIVSYHPMYKELGYTDEKRVEAYAKLFNEQKDEKKISFIKHSLEKQSITATPEFIKELESLVGMTLASKSRGRPKKQTKEKRKTMYKNLVVLDKEKHKDLKIAAMENLNFAKQSAFIPVLASEVATVGSNFPVVFSADENPSLIALVSLGGDSLAINEEGKWITQYVPSFLRKYPFALASTKENPEQKVILIDEESPLVSKSKGKQLFKKSGEQSELLTHAIEFLTNHENQAVITANVAKVISQSGILEEREISVGEGDEKKVLVNGFKVVDREKLNALSDDILADWVRKGIITLIDAHLESLKHIETLFKLTMQKQNIA